MYKRLIFLIALILAVGYCTSAFAATTQTVTRAQAIALLMNADSKSLARAQWYGSHMPPMPLFDDVDQTAWYAPYLETAFEQGLITGNAKNRTFRPNDVLREEEAIAIATRYKQLVKPTVSDEVILQIPGTQTNWLTAVVSNAKAAGIEMPFPVKPGSAISHAAFANMMASAGVRSPQSLTIASISILDRSSNTMIPTKVAIKPIVKQTVAATTTYRQPTYTQPRVTTTTNTRPTTTTTTRVATNTTTNAPAPTTPAASTKSFAITLPSLGIKDLTITHPASFTHEGLLAPLKYGVGHLFSYPGNGGKILVYGHSSSFPWDVSNYTKIFRQINKLAVGDLIYVTYGGKQYTYKVSYKQAVDAGDMTAYAQTGSEELILYTCWPPDSIKQRYLVHAVPVAE